MTDGSSAPTVAELMSTPVVTATPDETLAEAASRMREKHVGSVVVVQDDKPVGILTERDMIRIAAAGADTSTASVSEWMTPNPDSVAPGVPAAEAFASLSEHGYRHIPVVDGTQLVGLVSMRDLMRIAQVQPVERPAAEVPKGLEGVVVADTTIGDVRGLEGFYHYRQYNAIELAEKRTLEDVWHLLFEGELPSLRQRDDFIDEVKPWRTIPVEVKDLLPRVAALGGPDAPPLDMLRTTYSMMAVDLDYRPWLDGSRAELRAQALQTCAVVPTLLTALYRLKHGLEPIDPHPDLPYAANYLYMMQGEVPKPEYARAVEQYLISTIDHGFNASTFTARVITSTGADLGSAVIGAIGALSGPLHGGAPSRALAMLDAIGTEDKAEPWLRDAVERGDRLMGFGHRVYKTDDPRSTMLRGIAERLGGPKVDLAKTIERKAIEVLAEMKPGRQLYTNVEFYAGVVMDTCGVPREMFTPTFASSRVIGWTSHVLEQSADNRLIRPSAHYAGPPPPVPVPDVA
jgi:citrate synthase